MPARNGLTRVAVAASTFFAIGVVGADTASADKRIALVIGNSAYQTVPRLPNPAKDAAAMGDMLRKAGFNIVTARQDVAINDMRKLVRDFAAEASDADVAVVFYAGHGIEINGTNYLLPVDTKLARDVDVEDEAVSLDRVVRSLDPVKRLRLVVLDACRDNPFQQTMKRSLSSRGVSRGLAQVEPDNPNTLIAYAAKAGSTADDGNGDHSPFTTALLKQLPVPGQDLRKSLGYVRDEVLKQTANRQEPFVYGSLGGDDVALVPKAAAPAAVPAPVMALDPTSQLRQDYMLAAQINTEAAWDAFLKAYPNGYYGDLARAARAKLSGPANPQIAAITSERNLSAAQPDGHPSPGTTSRPAILNDLIGKSLDITFNERLEDYFNKGKIDRAGRELKIYINAANDVASRLVSVPFAPSNIMRYARAPFGVVDNGAAVTLGTDELIYSSVGQNYQLKIATAVGGNACTSRISFDLNPSEMFYLFRPTGSKLSAIVAEDIVCSVYPGDIVGPRPGNQPTAAAPTK
jgi:hypothetical protein